MAISVLILLLKQKYVYSEVLVKHNTKLLHSTGVLISPQPDQEGNKLQQQKILSFIYPIYNHNWRNISTIYIHNKTNIKRNILTMNRIFSPTQYTNFPFGYQCYRFRYIQPFDFLQYPDKISYYISQYSSYRLAKTLTNS